MAFVLQAAVKDLRRYAADPLGLLLSLCIPLAIGGLITLAMGGASGPKPRAHVLVVDRDDSFLSALLLGALSQGDSGLLATEEVGDDEGHRRIHDGDGSALLIVPDGFGAALLLQEPAELELLTNPSQRILPGIIEEMLEVLVDGAFYVHRVFGDEIREMSEGPPEGPEAVARLSVSMYEGMERLEKYLFPPVIDLEVEIQSDEPGESAKSASYALLFFPGVIVMALFFVAQGMSEDVWKERLQGTLRRVLVTPQSIVAFLAGKLAAGAVVIALVAGVSIGLGAAYHGIGFAVIPAAVAWSVLSGVGLLLLMMVLQLFAASQRAGSIQTNTVLFPLLMVGGSFFSFEAMPPWMASIGRATPNGWAVEQLKAILLGKAELGELVVAGLALVGVSVVLFLLCARRMQRVFARR